MFYLDIIYEKKPKKMSQLLYSWDISW